MTSVHLPDIAMAALPAHLHAAEIVVALAEYAEHVNPSRLRAFSASLEKNTEWLDAKVLGSLLRRNKNQHRHADYLQRLKQVHQCITLLDQLQVPSVLLELAAIMQKPLGPPRNIGKYQCRVASPTREAAVFVLRRLHAAATLCAQLPTLCAVACEALLAQVAASYFVPFCLSAAAACARLRVAASSYLLKCVESYNSALPSVAAFPQQRDTPSLGASLPQLLQVDWSAGLPGLRAVAFETPGGFQALAAQLAAQFEVSQGVSSLRGRVVAGSQTIEQTAAELASDNAHAVLMAFEDRGGARASESKAAVRFAVPEKVSTVFDAGNTRARARGSTAPSVHALIAEIVTAPSNGAKPSSTDREATLQDGQSDRQRPAKATQSSTTVQGDAVPMRPAGVAASARPQLAPKTHDWRALLRQQRNKSSASALLNAADARSAGRRTINDTSASAHGDALQTADNYPMAGQNAAGYNLSGERSADGLLTQDGVPGGTRLSKLEEQKGCGSRDPQVDGSCARPGKRRKVSGSRAQLVAPQQSKASRSSTDDIMSKLMMGMQ